MGENVFEIKITDDAASEAARPGAPIGPPPRPPAPPPAPAAPSPNDPPPPGWEKRYRELQNGVDSGRLDGSTPGIKAELERLSQALKDAAAAFSQPPVPPRNAAGPPPPPPVTADDLAAAAKDAAAKANPPKPDLRPNADLDAAFAAPAAPPAAKPPDALRDNRLLEDAFGVPPVPPAPPPPPEIRPPAGEPSPMTTAMAVYKPPASPAPPWNGAIAKPPTHYIPTPPPESTALATTGAEMAALDVVAPEAAVAEMAAEEAAKQEAEAWKRLQKGVELVGRTAQQLAGNDGIGALKTVSKAAADGLEQIPVVGQVYAAQLRAATAVVTTFTDTVNAFVARGRELAQYSGDLTAANAMADVRQTIADINEANVTGASIARLTEQQSKISAEFQAALAPVKDVIVRGLVAVLEPLEAAADLSREVRELLPDVREAAAFGREMRQSTFLELLGPVGRAIQWVIDRFVGKPPAQRPENTPNFNPIMDQVLGMNHRVPRPNDNVRTTEVEMRPISLLN